MINPGLTYEQLADLIERYESALDEGLELSLTNWLARTGNTITAEVYTELVRIDLEWRFATPQRQSLDTYLEYYPALRERHDLIGQLAFEEYRLRKEAGGSVLAAEYAQRYQCTVTNWDSLSPWAETQPNQNPKPPLGSVDLSGKSSATPDREGHASLDERLPYNPPDEVAGFQLLCELGRGTFSKVFLARQLELAERYVVVKFAADLTQEPLTLASLRHPLIGPIHSLHQIPGASVICMPLLGLVTLHDLLSALPGPQILFGSLADYIAAVHTVQDRRARHLVSVADDQGVTQTLQSWRLPNEIAPHVITKLTSPTRSSFRVALSLIRKIASALQHANEAGYTHGDLKPANILLQGDGSPLLVDFNLAGKTVPDGAGIQSRVGGTVAFMAPEQLKSLLHFDRQASVDPRADLYALGLITIELLTAVAPRRGTGSNPAEISQLYRERKSGFSRHLARIRRVSPATAAICRRLLAADPDLRYHSAAELVEDLDRFLSDRPLSYARVKPGWETVGNFFRRQSTARKLGFVSALAIVLVSTVFALLVMTRVQLEARNAQHSWREFQQSAEELHFHAEVDGLESNEKLSTLAELRATLELFSISTNRNWQSSRRFTALSPHDRAALVEYATQLLLLGIGLSIQVADDPATPSNVAASWEHQAGVWAATALASYPAAHVPRVVYQQQAELAHRAGNSVTAVEWEKQADETLLSTPFDHYLAARQALQNRAYTQAISEAEYYVGQRPQDIRGWLILNRAYKAVGDDRSAVLTAQAAVVIRPNYAPLHRNLGLASFRLGRYQTAVDSFNRAMELQGDQWELTFQRAIAKRAAGNVEGAIRDLNEILAQHPTDIRSIFQRSDCHRQLGDIPAADRDRDQGLTLVPTTTIEWITRGLALCPEKPHAALAAFREAERLEPDSIEALQNRAYVESSLLSQTEVAIETLDQALDLQPDFVPALIGRAVLLARRGESELARDDAERSLKLKPDGPTHYQAGCVYALTSPDDVAGQIQSIRLVLTGLALGFGADLIESDPDLDHLRNHPQFELVRAYQSAIAPAAMKTPTHTGK